MGFHSVLHLDNRIDEETLKLFRDPVNQWSSSSFSTWIWARGRGLSNPSISESFLHVQHKYQGFPWRAQGGDTCSLCYQERRRAEHELPAAYPGHPGQEAVPLPHLALLVLLCQVQRPH